MSAPTLDQLARLVRDMRGAQIAYFAARRRGEQARQELDESRRLEREVDRAIAEALSPQTDLFGAPATSAAEPFNDTLEF